MSGAQRCCARCGGWALSGSSPRPDRSGRRCGEALAADHAGRDSRIPFLPPRGNRRRDGDRLCQGDGEIARGRAAHHRRRAARDHGPEGGAARARPDGGARGRIGDVLRAAGTGGRPAMAAAPHQRRRAGAADGALRQVERRPQRRCAAATHRPARLPARHESSEGARVRVHPHRNADRDDRAATHPRPACRALPAAQPAAIDGSRAHCVPHPIR